MVEVLTFRCENLLSHNCGDDMNKNTLLKKAYYLFVSKYPDFPYTLNDIRLLPVTEDEYPLAFQNATNSLNLPVKATTDQLKQYSYQLKAELLKTPKRAIIIIRKSLLNASDESLRIIVHELAHAYHDIGFKNSPPTDDTMRFLYQIGERMWKEFVAEYYSVQILQLEEQWDTDAIKREFKSLLYSPSLYPERFGFFFMKCKATATSFSSVAEVADIKDRNVTDKLITVMNRIQSILEEGLRKSTTLEESNEFLIQLGTEIVTLVYHYYQCYNYLDIFLKQVDG